MNGNSLVKTVQFPFMGLIYWQSIKLFFSEYLFNLEVSTTDRKTRLMKKHYYIPQEYLTFRDTP